MTQGSISNPEFAFHDFVSQRFSPELILLANPLDLTVVGPSHLDPMDGIFSSPPHSFLLSGI
jgi:hypothetical protein